MFARGISVHLKIRKQNGLRKLIIGGMMLGTARKSECETRS